MAPDPSNSSNLEQLAVKGLIKYRYINIFLFPLLLVEWLTYNV